jgi:hypothetical protein
MEPINYFSVNEFSKGVLEFAEKAEYAKVLQAHIATVDEKSVRELEKEIAERKWAISEYLSSGSNYEEWKNYSNNNAEMLTKYVEKDYFSNEFSGTKLKEKISRDFGESLKSNPELAITKREKLTARHYDENDVPENKRTFLKEYDSVVANIHDKEKCFNRNLNRMLNDAPKKPTKEAEKVLSLVKENPLLLKDNPHHYVVNRSVDAPSVSSTQLKDIIDEAQMGDHSASAKLSKIASSYEDMNKGVTNKNLVEKYRKQFLQPGEKPTLKANI